MEIHLQENSMLTFDRDLGVGSRSHEMLPSTLYIQLQSLKLLTLTVFRRRYIYKKRDERTDGQRDGRRTDFGTILVCIFLLKKKRV